MAYHRLGQTNGAHSGGFHFASDFQEGVRLMFNGKNYFSSRKIRKEGVSKLLTHTASPLMIGNHDRAFISDGPMDFTVGVSAMYLKHVSFRTTPVILIFAVCCGYGCNRSSTPLPEGVASWSTPPTLTELTNSLASPNYGDRRAVTNHLWKVGHSTSLTDAEVRLMLPAINSDPDWRIRVRCIQNLPLAENKELVIPELIAALSIRDEVASGEGNVQLYACGALAEIGDRRALTPMREWLAFLQANPNMYKNVRYTLIERTRARIQEVEANAGR